MERKKKLVLCVCGCSCCCHFGEHWLWLHGFCFIYSRAAHFRARKKQTQIDAQAVSRKALEVTLMWICECSAIKLFLFIIIIFHSSETKAFGIYVIMSIDSNIVIVWVRLALCVCVCDLHLLLVLFSKSLNRLLNYPCKFFYALPNVYRWILLTHTHWQTSGNIIALYRSSLSYFVKCHIYHAPNNRDVLTSNSHQSSLQRRRNTENQNLSALEHQLHSIISFSKFLSMRSSSSFCTSSSSVDLVFRGFQDFQRCVLITRFALSWQPTTCDLISFRF